MRHLIAAALLAALSVPVIAADTTPPLPASCYLEGSTAGAFLRDGDRQGVLGVGAGCDAVLGSLVVLGGGIRADLGEAKAGGVYAKAGLLVNPHFTVYGLGEYRAPDFDLQDKGQFHVGGGAETNLFINNFSVFAEGTTAVAKWGPDVTKDDITVRVGARLRFGAN